jgi:hypothetical protein
MVGVYDVTLYPMPDAEIFLNEPTFGRALITARSFPGTRTLGMAMSAGNNPRYRSNIVSFS